MVYSLQVLGLVDWGWTLLFLNALAVVTVVPEK